MADVLGGIERRHVRAGVAGGKLAVAYRKGLAVVVWIVPYTTPPLTNAAPTMPANHHICGEIESIAGLSPVA